MTARDAALVLLLLNSLAGTATACILLSSAYCVMRLSNRCCMQKR